VAESNKQFDLKELTEKWAKGQLSAEEEVWLENWYSGFNDEKITVSDSRHHDVDGLRKHILENIQAEVGIAPKRNTLYRYRNLISIAASLILGVGIAFFFYSYNARSYNARLENQKVLGNNIGPGGNKAYLTLADGRKIFLSDAQTGKLADQGSATVSKTNDGSVRYDADDAAGESSARLNTITTPRGGVYHLTLADNTQVWLNAASSITYPVAFRGHERQVSITGEVYFEVAHHADKPFIVTGREQQVEVLGTHFNVNTYDNEPENKTTLLEGSVRITAGKSLKILKPGQQAVFSRNRILIKDANVNEAVAWKEGYFEFENIDIQSLMRQISRWYDVDVQFDGPVSNETFTGRISRFKNISQILSIIQASQSVHLTISGRRIMVKQ
jgi:transmembrane sensor